MEEHNMKQKKYHNLKNKLIYVFCFGSMLAVLGGVYYACFFREIHIDLTNNMTISFTGENGNGHILAERHDFNYNQRIEPFYDSLSASFSKDGTLSNGEEVTITVTYDQALADKFNIIVEEHTLTAIVEGLAQRFSSSEDIPAAYLEQLTKKSEDYIVKESNHILTQDFSFSTAVKMVDQEMIQRVFLKANDAQIHDKIIDIYKLSAEGKHDSEEILQETIYYMVVFDDINSNLTLSDAQIYGEKALYTEEDLSEETGIIRYFRNKYVLSYEIEIVE